MVRKILLFWVWAIVILIPVSGEKYVFRQNDLPAKLMNEAYLKKEIFAGRWPQWNPLINEGIPMAADPLSDYFNPLMGILFTALPQELAIKIIYVMCTAGAGITMFLLARETGISKWTATILGLTYETGGYLIGRIQAGHLEKVLTYPLVPLFLLFLGRTVRRGGKWSMGLGLVWALILYSGELYNWWYAAVILGWTVGYVLIVKKKSPMGIIKAVIWGLAFGAVKWWPMLLAMSRITKVQEPWAGSQNLISIGYHLFFSWSSALKTLHLWNLVPTNFGWWEKAAFIGPVFAVGLIGSIFWRKKTNLKNWGWWAGAVVILVLVAMPARKLNPYHYLVNNIGWLSGMHVPTRVFGILTVIILIAAGKALDRKIFRTLLIINLAGVMGFWGYAMVKKQPGIINPEFGKLLSEIKPGQRVWQPAMAGQIPQNLLAEKGVEIVNTTYGVNLTGSLAANYWNNIPDETDIPDWALVSTADKLPDYFEAGSTKTAGTVKLVKIKNATPVVSSGNAVWGTDEIKVKAFGNGGEKLTVLENYFPGWKLAVDGIPVILGGTGWLETKLLPGYHEYVFRYNLDRFIVGLLVSFAAVAGAEYAIIKARYVS